MTAFSQVPSQTQSLSHEAPAVDDSDAFLLEILDLCEQRWINAQQIEQLMSDHGVNSTQDKIAFLREFLQFIRHLPEALFSDLEQRQHWISISQELLDSHIDQEEEELASGE